MNVKILFNKIEALGSKYDRLPIFLFVIGFLVRIILSPHHSDDLLCFVEPWTQHFRDYGIIYGLAHVHEECNYMPLYTYFLCPISLLQPQYYVYGIKFFSVLFDIVLCYSISYMLYHIDHSIKLHLTASIMWLVPTLFWNSSYWGQCDVMYSTFCVLTIFSIMKRRPILACVMFGLAFAFKMQAIFILPFLFVALIHGEVKIWHFVFALITVIITVVPSLIAGRPISEILMIYIGQANQDPRLSQNLANPYIFISNDYYEPVRIVGMVLTVSFTLLYGYLLRPSNYNLNIENMLVVAMVGAIIIPYILPCMHDRYLYLGDQLSVAYLLLKRTNISLWIAFCTVSTSFFEYARYSRLKPYLPEEPGFLLYTASVVLIIIVLVGTCRKTSNH